MKKMTHNVAALIALFVFCMSFSTAMAKDEPAKVAAESKVVAETKGAKNEVLKIVNASRAVKEITAIPKRKIPPVLLKEAAAVIIFPKAAKNSFMVKGGITGGVLLVQDKAGTWSRPVFVTVSGGTLGWQIVGDPMDIVLLFKNIKHIDAILKGELTLDTKIAIVPGRAALTMKGASKKELDAEVTSYVLSHGSLSEESVVAGTTLKIDAAANDLYYGKPKIDAGEILSGKTLKSAEEITTLQKLLSGYAAAK